MIKKYIKKILLDEEYKDIAMIFTAIILLLSGVYFYRDVSYKNMSELDIIIMSIVYFVASILGVWSFIRSMKPNETE